MKKKQKQKILIGIGVVSSGSVIVLISIAGLIASITKKPFIAAFQNPLLYVLVLILILGIILFVIFDIRVRGSKRVLKVNVDLENSHWMEPEEIKKNNGFMVTKFSELNKVDDGVPLVAELKKNDIQIVLKKPIHVLVIGATGTGKSAAFVSPSLEILMRTKSKPSIVVTDPKGELYQTHAESFKKQGYKVNVINLSDVYHSTKWNPFNDIIKKTEEMKYSNVVQKNGKYYVSGVEYLTNAEATKVCKERAVQLKDEIYVDIQDLVYTMCPVENKQDSTWQKGARDLIFALVLAFWEDFRDGYMPKEKFNLDNLYRNVSEYAKGECEDLIAYFAARDETSRTKGLSNTVLVSTDRTLSSYLGDVNQYMNWLADGGIAALTSGNEIEFSNFDEEPNVLFLIVPDQKENRYTLVTLFMIQMYKALVEKATRNEQLKKTSKQELLRNVYFFMDEFGNLPRIHNMDKIVTVGRSRHIYVVPIIQDFNQLENKYGKEVSAIIRSNCNIQVFIGSNDENTRRIISENCGKKKVKQVSYNENKDMSVSTSAQSVPLIYPTELEKLNDPDNGILGNMIVTTLGNYPIKSKMTPLFKAPQQYQLKKSEFVQNDFNAFDEKRNFYDIRKITTFLANDKKIAEEQHVELDENDASEQTEQVKQVEQVQQVGQAEQVANEKVLNKIKTLKDKISNEQFDNLVKDNIDFERKIVILEELIELYSNNSLLVAELVFIKKFIQYNCLQMRKAVKE